MIENNRATVAKWIDTDRFSYLVVDHAGNTDFAEVPMADPRVVWVNSVIASSLARFYNQNGNAAGGHYIAVVEIPTVTA